MNDPTAEPQEKVGFRDIYRAVGESETRIKEHISLTLLPIVSSLADHEVRIRSIEEKGSTEARDAMAKAELIAVATEALVSRVDKHDDRFNAIDSAGAERRRITDLSTRTLGAIVLASNFILGIIIMFANLLTDHSHG